MLKKKPNRTADDVTQCFNDGIVKIYEITDTASAGYFPQKQYNLIIELRYFEKTVGITRFYAAMQNQIKISKIIRVPKTHIELNTNFIAEINSKKYNIEQIQNVSGIYPACFDLTLTDFETG